MTRGTSVRGRLVAFEGIDGCGKSTQARLLAERLVGERGVEVVETREPGGTAIGTRLRDLLLGSAPDGGGGSDSGGGHLVARAEALLMLADRAQHVDEVIEPALARGAWVVTDRFGASTLAYQGHGRFGGEHAALDALARANAWAAAGTRSDPSVLVRVPVAVALTRMRAAGRPSDRFEGEGAAFLEAVAAGFDRLVDENPDGWVVVDGTPRAEAVAERVWEALAGRWAAS